MRMKNGFSANQLMFERYPLLPNRIGENSPISLERGRGAVFERNIKCST